MNSCSPSKRQSSTGAVSVAQEGGEEPVDDVLEPEAPKDSQDFVDRELSNFLSYANRKRLEVPIDQPLFFSDLAPIADSTVSDTERET
jgi:hypothetical protein